jgi:hypothetical protein
MLKNFGGPLKCNFFDRTSGRSPRFTYAPRRCAALCATRISTASSARCANSPVGVDRLRRHIFHCANCSEKKFPTGTKSRAVEPRARPGKGCSRRNPSAFRPISRQVPTRRRLPRLQLQLGALARDGGSRRAHESCNRGIIQAAKSRRLPHL